jgi:uncharacterized spore protein YtfJ
LNAFKSDDRHLALRRRDTVQKGLNHDRRCTMQTVEMLEKARDALTVRAAVGEPLHENGVTILPMAKIRSGAGGGESPEGSKNPGRGGGFGATSTPVGAFVIKEGTVSWRPAVDINKIILGAQAVAIVALLTIRAIVKARSRH